MYLEVYCEDDLVITCSSVVQCMQHMNVIAEHEHTMPVVMRDGSTRINDKLYTIKCV